MSAKKTARHIQNNFRLTTKLLSDSNILPVSKVLLKNNFPTYELPLHNPNSRPKRKKANIDCPPCPPIERDCPEPENNYAGQTSYLHPRSKFYPRSKWEPKTDNHNLLDKYRKRKEYLETEGKRIVDILFKNKNISKEEKNKLWDRKRKISNEYESSIPIWAKAGMHSSEWLIDQTTYDQKTNYFGEKQELDSSEIFRNSSLDESDYVDNTDFEDVDVERIKKNLESGKLTPLIEETISKYGNEKNKFDTIQFAELINDTLLNEVSKFDNNKLKTFFESHYTNLKSEKYLKEIQESFELALVMRSREYFISETTKDAFERILSLYNNQPVLNVRTSDSVQKQAYSTPIPLGFLISNYLDLYSNTVYEPCAGNGSLLICAGAGNVIANEIDPIRLKHLQHLGFKTNPGSALDFSITGTYKFKRIVMNPPFGSYPANQHIKVNGKAITNIDQAIAIYSLQFLEKDGLAAIILGGHNLTKDPRGGFKATDQFFLNHIYRNYDVIKNIDINGDLYRKQGTSFDIRLIILRNSNTKELRHVLPYQYGEKQGQILKANTWDDLYNFLSDKMHREVKPGQESAMTHADEVVTKKYSDLTEFEVIAVTQILRNYEKYALQNFPKGFEKAAKDLQDFKAGKIPDDYVRDFKNFNTLLKTAISKYRINNLSDIPNSIKNFMPLHQQKAIIGNKELGKVLHDLERQILNTPKTYETENIDTPDKVLRLHYFYAGSDWYIVERDNETEQRQAYGYAILNEDFENAEFGYIHIEEFKNSNKVELDFYWTPIKFKDLKKGYKNEQHERTERDQTDQSNANRESRGMVRERNEFGGIQGHPRYSRDSGNTRSRVNNRQDDGKSGHSKHDSEKRTKRSKGTSRNSSSTERDGMPGESNSSNLSPNIEIQKVGFEDESEIEFDEKKAAMISEFFQKMGL